MKQEEHLSRDEAHRKLWALGRSMDVNMNAMTDEEWEAAVERYHELVRIVHGHT